MSATFFRENSLRKEMKKRKLTFFSDKHRVLEKSRNKEEITERDMETLKNSKMKYYMLFEGVDDKTDIICYSEAEEPGDTPLHLMFCRGIKCESWDGNFCFYYDEKEGNRATDFLANDMGCFLVSDKLRKVLESLNTEIQFLAVKIMERKSRKELPDYYIANILRVVDALCLEKSVYYQSYMAKLGIICNVVKYGIFAEKTENSDVFKLADGQEIPIFVSENFKNKVEKEEITGIDFLEIKVFENE